MLLFAGMATFELYRRSTIGMCLTETLDEMVQSGTLTPELAIQVLVQFDKVRVAFLFFVTFPPRSSTRLEVKKAKKGKIKKERRKEK